MPACGNTVSRSSSGASNLLARENPRVHRPHAARADRGSRGVRNARGRNKLDRFRHPGNRQALPRSLRDHVRAARLPQRRARHTTHLLRRAARPGARSVTRIDDSSADDRRQRMGRTHGRRRPKHRRPHSHVHRVRHPWRMPRAHRSPYEQSSIGDARVRSGLLLLSPRRPATAAKSRAIDGILAVIASSRGSGLAIPLR